MEELIQSITVARRRLPQCYRTGTQAKMLSPEVSALPSGDIKHKCNHEHTSVLSDLQTMTQEARLTIFE